LILCIALLASSYKQPKKQCKGGDCTDFEQEYLRDSSSNQCGCGVPGPVGPRGIAGELGPAGPQGLNGSEAAGGTLAAGEITSELITFSHFMVNSSFTVIGDPIEFYPAFDTAAHIIMSINMHDYNMQNPDADCVSPTAPNCPWFQNTVLLWLVGIVPTKVPPGHVLSDYPSAITQFSFDPTTGASGDWKTGIVQLVFNITGMAGGDLEYTPVISRVSTTPPNGRIDVYYKITILTFPQFTGETLPDPAL